MSKVPSVLPPNATRLERAVEASELLVLKMVMLHALLKDPYRCPEKFLPWLAWELSLDTWDSQWPLHIKRQRIASAIAIQRHKGTAGSVRDVIESFGGSVMIREWWQMDPPGPPHSFELLLILSGRPGVDATAKYVEDVISEVNRTKPVRSYFTFTQGAEFQGQVALVGAIRPAVYRRLQMSTED